MRDGEGVSVPLAITAVENVESVIFHKTVVDVYFLDIKVCNVKRFLHFIHQEPNNQNAQCIS